MGAQPKSWKKFDMKDVIANRRKINPPQKFLLIRIAVAKTAFSGHHMFDYLLRDQLDC